MTHPDPATVRAVLDALDAAGARRIAAQGPLAAALNESGRTTVETGRDRAFDAVVADAAATGPGADERLAGAQRLLRPGGRLITIEPTRGPARRLLPHYFEKPSSRALPGGRALLIAATRTHDHVLGHFNDIAPHYAGQIPPHLREHYLDRKLRLIERLLGAGWAKGVGLDLGCGLGWYANAMAERHGARIVALDPSSVPLRLGRRDARPGRAPRFVAGDSLKLPFSDGAFDYAYAINMLHHLKRGEQARALREVRRVLKPQGAFLVFEINTRNPLFAWYMRHVFPRTRSIDRGDEEFLLPEEIPLGEGFRLERVEHSTFTADFLPEWLLGPARRVEAALERTAIARYGIHYAALLRPA